MHVVHHVPGTHMSELCAHGSREPRGGNRQHLFTDTNVQNNRLIYSRGGETCSPPHALQSAQIAPRPRPMCPAGFPVCERLVCCREVPCAKRRQKYVYMCWPMTKHEILWASVQGGLYFRSPKARCRDKVPQWQPGQYQ